MKSEAASSAFSRRAFRKVASFLRVFWELAARAKEHINLMILYLSVFCPYMCIYIYIDGTRMDSYLKYWLA